MAGETKASQSVTGEEESTFLVAVAYALAGVRVFPTYWPDPDQAGMCGCGNPECSSPGKHPLTEHGHKDATTDLDQVFDWWAQHPDANVAARPAEDEFVLDVDPRHGGLESLKELEGEFGPFETRTHRTGSGGFHYWFKTATPVRSRTGLLPGIDIKAASGYVLMPPSLHVQGKYEVVDGREPAMAPEGLTQLIGDARETRSLAGLTPEQLIQFSAPGETPEERLRWTRSALDMIPNNQDYNDRNRWIGMAHAIRASCGEDLEQEASELFDEFSKRWETDRYDPHKTRRAWETLGSSDDPGGFDRLLRRALDHGYVMPSDHPYRAENEFSVVAEGPEGAESGGASKSTPTDPLDRLIKGFRSAPRSALPDLIDEFRANTSGLNPLERRIAEAEATTELFHRYRSLAAANEILRGQTMETVGPFEFVDGKNLIRAADPREACSTSPYLVDGMIPEGALGEVIADYGCGKTCVMIDLALSVAFGVQFFGNEVQKRSVLYLAYEGQHGIWKRMAGWLHYHGFLPAEFTAADLHDKLEGRITVAAIPPLFDHPNLEEGLRDSVRELEAGLVIIDTRNKSLGPDQSEDSNDTAGHVNGVLSRVAAQTGCTFFTTHHIGHTKKARGRGASAWTQGVDFSFLIAGDAAMMTAGYPMTVKPLKMRDDQWPDQVAFRLKKIKGLCVDGQDWNTAVIHAVSAMPAVQDRASIQARVFSYVQGHPGCSGEAVRRAVHGNNDEIQAEKDRLVRMGAIENLGRPNRHSYHSAPGWHVNHKGEVVRLEEGDRKDAAGDADEPSPDEERTDA